MYGVFMAEVEVDVKTGKTKVVKMTLIDDVGVVGSRQAVDGQAYGGLMQGIGLALSEDYENVNKDISLIACGLPFINDVPDELEVDHVETYRPKGPHGSVGCSELQLSAPHASILNAIYNATKVRIRVLPATPDKVLKGLEDIKNGTIKKSPKYYFGSDLHERIADVKKNPVVPK